MWLGGNDSITTGVLCKMAWSSALHSVGGWGRRFYLRPHDLLWVSPAFVAFVVDS
jgi:hypothetical protein